MVAESRISRDEYLKGELASEILELPDAGLTIPHSELYREVWPIGPGPRGFTT